jgi:hypothetical protein
MPETLLLDQRRKYNRKDCWLDSFPSLDSPPAGLAWGLRCAGSVAGFVGQPMVQNLWLPGTQA